MDYLKPQSPLQHKDGNYFYPLTTIDQVIMPDESRLNANLISINLDEVVEGSPNKINADTLQGYTAEDFFNSKSSDVQLNYSIIGGLTEPSNPTENMIWIETDVPITSHIFSKIEPINPFEGMIWIITSNSSDVAFHSIKINDIYIDEKYPLFAKQYINNEWIIVESKIYKNKEWKDWAHYLYNSGSNISEFYSYKPTTGSYSAMTPTTFTEHGILVSTTGGGTQGVRIITSDKVTFTGYSKLCCLIDFQSALSSGAYSFLRVVTQANTTSYVGNVSHDTPWIVGEYVYELDVSGFAQNYVEINIDTYDEAVSLLIKKVWLE